MTTQKTEWEKIQAQTGNVYINPLQMKKHTRTRWGIEHPSDFDRRNGEARRLILGIGWIPEASEHPYHDYWPANYRTRREARAVAQLMRARARGHSGGWLFRPIKLRITVEPAG